MRRIAPSLLILPVLVACGSPAGSGGQGSASCAQPYLNNQPPNGGTRAAAKSVRPGGSLTIYGHWYTSTCNDTSSHDPLKALPPVHLTLTLPGGRVESLGEFVPSGADMGFAASLRIPAGTHDGIATITDDQTPYPASYRFVVAAT